VCPKIPFKTFAACLNLFTYKDTYIEDMNVEKEGNMIVTQAIVAWEPLEPYKLNYSLEDVVVHPPTGNEVLVEVQASGICHTDNYLSSVPTGLHGVAYPKVAGHEGMLTQSGTVQP
jgi:hypothetical protein